MRGHQESPDAGQSLLNVGLDSLCQVRTAQQKSRFNRTPLIASRETASGEPQADSPFTVPFEVSVDHSSENDGHEHFPAITKDSSSHSCTFGKSSWLAPVCCSALFSSRARNPATSLGLTYSLSRSKTALAVLAQDSHASQETHTALPSGSGFSRFPITGKLLELQASRPSRGEPSYSNPTPLNRVSPEDRDGNACNPQINDWPQEIQVTQLNLRSPFGEPPKGFPQGTRSPFA